jgi:hypothetical protein
MNRIITNGTSAISRMEEAGISGDKAEWLEALHEGPVPITESHLELNQQRARHFESIGWTSYEDAMSGFEERAHALQDATRYDALQLWFEHDLYDQLQLIQLLDFLAERPDWLVKAYLVQFDDFLERVPLSLLAGGAQRATPITSRHIELAQAAWSAFRQPSPFAFADLLNRDCSPLPYLRAAILRLCQEFPDPASGLGRTERQILMCLSKGPANLLDVFQESQTAEEAAYLGDSGFLCVVKRLTQGEHPLIDLPQDGTFSLPINLCQPYTYSAQSLRLSEAGLTTLQGQADWLQQMTSPYWIGGCLIDGPAAPRWDESTQSFCK